jgi:tetratricopeptide (TPR) repeat protein
MRRLVRVVANALLLLALAAPARADDTSERALDLFEQSEVAYDRGRFDEALSLLRQSYALKKEPVLLYNIGRAYEGRGDLRAAASAYQSFLAAQPNTPDRGALESRIATLRRQAGEREELERRAERDRDRDRAATAPGKQASPVPWIVTGVGAGGAGAGAVLLALAARSHDKAVAEPTYREADRLQSRAQTFATVGNIAWIAGAALVVTGVVWGLVDLSATRNRRTAYVDSLAIVF